MGDSRTFPFVPIHFGLPARTAGTVRASHPHVSLGVSRPGFAGPAFLPALSVSFGLIGPDRAAAGSAAVCH